MSFIRLKKRVTKTKENYYAYLVSNTWHNNLPRQKVSSYLGRYHKLAPKHIKIKPFKENNFLLYLLKKELQMHDFKQKNKDLFIHPSGFIVNLKKKKVLDKNSDNNVCLGINQGFICNYTLNNLLKFKPKNKQQAPKLMIKLLLEIGIKPDKSVFLEALNKLKLV